MKGIDELYRLSEVAVGEPAPMMLFPVGEWTSADYPDLTLTQELANEVIANFDAEVLRTKVPVESVGKHDATSPAGGWFERLYMAPFEWQGVAGEALYGDWTPNKRGAQLVNDGEYAYNSVEIGDHKDPVSGDVTHNVLKAVALTNRPVLRMMPPVGQAGESVKLAEPVTVQLAEVEANPLASLRDDMLALASKVDEAMKGRKGVPVIRTMLREAFAKLSVHLSEDDGDPVEPNPASSDGSSRPAKADEGQPLTLAEGDAAQKGSDSMNPAIIKLLKLSEGASNEAVEAAVVKLSEERDTALSERDSEKTRADTAVAKLAEAEKAQRTEKVEAKLSELIKGGHVSPGQKETWLKLAEVAPEQFDAMAEQAEKVRAIDLSERGSGKEGGESTKRADVELAEKTRARMAADKIDFSAAKALVLSEDADLRERYLGFLDGKEG